MHWFLPQVGWVQILFRELQRDVLLGNDNNHFLNLQPIYTKDSEALIKMNGFGNSDSLISRYSDISGPSGSKPPFDFIANSKNDFTTYDWDNDKSTSQNCLKTHNDAWWYGDCSHEGVNLNGEHNKHERMKTEHAANWKYKVLEPSEIKIRRLV